MILNKALLNRFHPINDQLYEFKPWGGVECMKSVFHRYLDIPDRKYYGDVFELALIAGIARVHEHGCKHDVMPVLEGVTGTRKSTLIKELGMGFFLEFNTDVSDAQKIIENARTAWVPEMGDKAFKRNRFFVWPGTKRGSPRSDRNSPVTLPYGLWTANNSKECLFDRG